MLIYSIFILCYASFDITPWFINPVPEYLTKYYANVSVSMLITEFFRLDFTSNPPKQYIPPNKKMIRNHDLETIKEMIYPTLLSYCKENNIKNFNCSLYCDRPYKFFKILEFPDLGGLIIIAKFYNKLVIAFRGTKYLANWQQNLAMNLVPFQNNSNIRVHRGFYNLYTSFRFTLLKSLFKIIQKNNLPIYIIGYSLGGALATLSVSDIVDLTISLNSTREIHLITYAAPRTGNLEFVKMIISKNISISRVVNKGDLVSLMPSRAQNYTHLPNEVFIKSYGWFFKEIIYCDNYLENGFYIEENLDCSYSSWSRLSFWPLKHASMFENSLDLAC